MAPAKNRLIQLAGRVDLFPSADFPVSSDGRADLCYRLSEDEDGGYALYANSGTGDQSYRPHNHGDAWVIIAAIEGCERHWVYEHADADPAEGKETLNVAGEIDVKPGTGITLLPGGIHSIQAQTSTLLHLHLYARFFETQTARLEFDA